MHSSDMNQVVTAGFTAILTGSFVGASLSVVRNHRFRLHLCKRPGVYTGPIQMQSFSLQTQMAVMFLGQFRQRSLRVGKLAGVSAKKFFTMCTQLPAVGSGNSMFPCCKLQVRTRHCLL